MLKFKVEFTFEDDEIKEIFESYDLKFTKKRLAELKEDLKENSAFDDFRESLSDEIINCLGEWIDNMFDE